MSTLAISLGVVILFELIAFTLLYRFTRWQGKQVAFLVILVVIGLYLPVSILTWKGLDWFAIHFAFYVMIPYVLGIITTHWEIREQIDGPSRGKWFHWGPASLVVFFICIAVVDAAILTFAEKGMSTRLAAWILPPTSSGTSVTSLFPGTVANDFHKKESLYNEFLARRHEQDARGWQVRKGWVGEHVAGKPATFKLRVLDREGAPVAGAKVNGSFLRSSNQIYDQIFEMDDLGAGEYSVTLTLNQPGTWTLALTIDRNGERHEILAETKLLRTEG